METPLPDPHELPEGHRSGYAALVGRPNAGKSTLMNALLGRKLSIVTRKPQTTRHRVLGIHSDAESQVVFLDTPGLIEPRYRLQEVMVESARGAIAEADVLLFLSDAATGRPDTFSLDFFKGRPALLVLTKMDRITQTEAIPLVEAYTQLRAFEEIVPTSAVTGFNLDVLMEEVKKRLPLGPPFYSKDQVSEHPERFFVAEIIREKALEQYRQEVPYALQVNITAFQERPNDKLLIDAEIVVSETSHKGILIGKGGRAIKRLGAAARRDIEPFVGEAVYLQLHVKVRKGWREKDSFLRSYGYRA